MPLRIGLIAYPLFAIAVALSKGGIVSKFARAGALSPETARKPGSLSINDVEMVKSAAKRGMLVATGDGRYYVNRTKYKRRQRFINAGLLGAGVLIAGVTLLSLLAHRPWEPP